MIYKKKTKILIQNISQGYFVELHDDLNYIMKWSKENYVKTLKNNLL